MGWPAHKWANTPACECRAAVQIIGFAGPEGPCAHHSAGRMVSDTCLHNGRPYGFWAPRRQTVNLSCFVSWGPGSVPGTLLEVLVRLSFGRLLPAASHLHEGAPQAHCASSRKGTKEGRAHMCPLQRGPGSCTFHFHFDPIGQKFVIWPHLADRLLGNLVLF